MADFDNAKAQQVAQQLAALPEIQDFIHRQAPSMNPTLLHLDASSIITKIAKEHGIDVEPYALDVVGDPVNGGWTVGLSEHGNPWTRIVLPTVAIVGGGALAGLAAGGASGAAATGAAGAGATGSTIPVTGALAPALTGSGAVSGGVAAGAGAAGATSAGSILGTAGKVGTALGNIGAARANGRAAEADINAQQDRNQLTRDQLLLTAPSLRARNAVRGDILANAQDFAWGAPKMVGNIPVPTSTGGLRPSMFSPATRQLGSQISQDALKNQQTGADVPGLTPLPQANLYDSILNTAGTVGSLAGIYANRSVDPNNPTIPRKKAQPDDPQGGF